MAAESRPLSDDPPTEPHSIFDKRQKWLIILIASTAATCEQELVYLIDHMLMTDSFRVCIQHLLPSAYDDCARLACLSGAHQSYCNIVLDTARHRTQFLGAAL